MYRRKNFQAGLIADDDKEMDNSILKAALHRSKLGLVGDSSWIEKGF
jgi:hypothetical protein